MKEHLVISAMGPDRPGLVNELSTAILSEEASIDDSRMMILGGEFAIILMVSGEESRIQKLQTAIEAVLDRLMLKGVVKSTSAKGAQPGVVPFEVDILAMDDEGIVNTVTSFFARQNINIENLVTDTYSAPHTGTPMFSLQMIVSLPTEGSVSALKEEFLSLCDELYIDVSMEPATSLF